MVSMAACAIGCAVPNAPADAGDALPGVGASVTQTIGADGGTLELVDNAGDTVQLEFPPGAVPDDVEFVLTQRRPRAASVIELELLPSNLIFGAPVTLRYRGAAPLDRELAWHWEAETGPTPVPTQISGESAVTQLRISGYPVAEPNGLGAADRAPARLTLTSVECAERGARLSARLREAAQSDRVSRAIQLHDELVTMKLQCAQVKQAELAADACAAYDGALARADAAVIDSVQSFRGAVIPLLAAFANVQVMTGECGSGARVDAATTANFERLIDFLRRRIDEPDFGEELLDRRLRELVEFAAECQLLFGGAQLCTRFETELYPPMLDLMRRGAFADCLSDGTALSLSQLYKLGQGVSDGRYFFQVAHFTEADLERDVSYCVEQHLHAAVFRNADTVPTENMRRTSDFDLLDSDGGPQEKGTVVVAENGSVTVSGTLRGLVCPDATVSPDELVIRIRGREIARRSLRGNVFTLDTNPLDLVIAPQLAAGADPNQEGAFDVTFNREGPACAGLFSSSFPIFTLTVRLATLSVTPAAPRLAILEKRTFSATFDDEPVSGVNWSATLGTIDARGNYTAGSTPGMFTITAAANGRTVTTTGTIEMPDMLCDVTVTHSRFTDTFVCPATLGRGAGSTMRVCGGNDTFDLRINTPTPLVANSMLSSGAVPRASQNYLISYRSPDAGSFFAEADAFRFTPITWSITVGSLGTVTDGGTALKGDLSITSSLPNIGFTDSVQVSAGCH